MTSQQRINDLLMRGCDDFVYLAEVTSVVKFVGHESPTELQTPTIELVRLVIERGLMEIGDLRKDGFHKWEMPIEESLRRVELEWNALGRPPSLGEICWLRNTEKGNQLGESLFKERNASG